MTDKPKAVKNKSKEPTQIQKFMDMYCNKVKKSNIATVIEVLNLNTLNLKKNCIHIFYKASII